MSLQFLLLLGNLSTAADFIEGENAIHSKVGGDGKMTATLTGSKRVVSVERRGSSGGGGHGGGGGHASGGSHGGGGRAVGGNRGPKLIPYYVAGAMPHRQNNQHHRNGSGQGNRSSFGPPSLLLVLLCSLCIF
ncbi:hypothetical protein M5689_022679 [Euphorbia peplus]|nr:hypothetical protein M5689_022679 [Euphorbia peplus]